jgi:uncharacterized RmlC-like cupin family protein
VRILRIQYPPGDKSVMHEHPNSVAVFMSDQRVKFTYPDGKSEEVPAKAGEAKWIPAGSHLPENLSGPGRKYDDVCCAQFGLGRGARREHPPPVGL